MTSDIEQALEDLMHKHDLIGVAGDNPALEARLIAFAKDALEEAALRLEGQHTWLTNVAAANLVRALKGGSVCDAVWDTEDGNMGDKVERCRSCGTYKGNPCRKLSHGSR